MRTFVIASLLAVAACGGKDKPTQTPANTAADPTTTAPAGVAPAASPEPDFKCEGLEKDALNNCGLDGFDAYVTWICQCADQTCASQRSEAMAHWAEGMANRIGDDPGTPELNQRADAIGARMGECMTKLTAPPADEDGSAAP